MPSSSCNLRRVSRGGSAASALPSGSRTSSPSCSSSLCGFVPVPKRVAVELLDQAFHAFGVDGRGRLKAFGQERYGALRRVQQVGPSFVRFAGVCRSEALPVGRELVFGQLLAAFLAGEILQVQDHGRRIGAADGQFRTIGRKCGGKDGQLFLECVDFRAAWPARRRECCGWQFCPTRRKRWPGIGCPVKRRRSRDDYSAPANFSARRSWPCPGATASHRQATARILPSGE